MLALLAKVLAEQALIEIHNEEKIQEAIDKYQINDVTAADAGNTEGSG